MAMAKDKHSVLRDLTPPLSTWSLRSSLLIFLMPLMIHFQRNELFMAYALVSFMVFRAGFYMNEIVSGTHLLYLSPSLYKMLYFGNLWVLLGGLFYQGIYFRQDFSSIVIWSYLLGKITLYTFNIHLSSTRDWGSNYDFAQWDLIIVATLFGNLALRDVSYPIVLVDFVKGTFWGAVLHYFIYHKEAPEPPYSLSKCLYCIWEGCGIPRLDSLKPQMAPFKASAMGGCSCESEEDECTDPDDILDDAGDDQDGVDCDYCDSPKSKQHEL